MVWGQRLRINTGEQRSWVEVMKEVFEVRVKVSFYVFGCSTFK
jgi:hypothetical protein